jgi:hypothetical protein
MVQQTRKYEEIPTSPPRLDEKNCRIAVPSCKVLYLTQPQNRAYLNYISAKFSDKALEQERLVNCISRQICGFDLSRDNPLSDPNRFRANIRCDAREVKNGREGGRKTPWGAIERRMTISD